MAFFSSLFALLFISRFLENSLLSTEVKEGEILPPTIQKLMKGYNKYLRPFFDNGPVTVGMSLDIASIDTISEINMDYTATIFLRQRWTDERLGFEGNKSLSLDGGRGGLLWVPDTFIVDSKKSFLHDITVENRLIRIFPNGTVLYALRITTTVACSMDLTKYPMDRQTCTLQLESCRTLILFPGNYPKLIFHFELKRSILYFILETYVPSSLLVVLSWVSFWISQSSVPARICIGVTTVLTMTTLMMGARTSLPNANCFIKAIDVYLGICFSFIFGALIEYAMAHFCTLQHPDYNNALMYGHHMHECEEEMNGILTTIARDSSRLKRCKDAPAPAPTAAGEPGLTPSSPTASEPKTAEVPSELFSRCAKNISVLRKILRSINCCHVENPHYIDNYSRLTFPLSFIIVNLLYWTYYLYF
ncbi:gamma-aminobutyric acid receptor subunit pi-like [Sinocyclocheilus rhinocerous]|uniref:gamma-aminobutyric acid receptor subunit pi-like n=1 Tax=Sinocyclocheilus rhinocerous TaxID=307959 RepID=UPI0007BA15BF|nr:PREDICTED: gamma-aminobutyric acid receptor subunit pi-like [Sinocyclocheilus rhinocerous]